ncbi:MAG: ATP-binding protein [Candidatus Binatia bacterium]
MHCAACSQENSPGSKFCLECGRPLLRRCAICGTEVPPAARFCAECGGELHGPGGEAGADGERRQLTVMFCDLVGSTDLSQRLDAEDLRTVVRAYQDAAARVIERHEGHIAQYLGDGLLVYFGYPQAHEDDAERAVRAGLGIIPAVRALGFGGVRERTTGLTPGPLAVRIGIHTGKVVVGAMGGGARSEILALGDTTNIAARLEAAAAPDSVVISADTLRLVPGMFLVRDLGTPTLKGIARPIQTYAVIRPSGVRSRLDVDPRTLTPLVGREPELASLSVHWQQVREGAGRAVAICGEAGIGKSRLLQALRERLAGAPHTWLECRSTPYTQSSSFHPLVELLTQGLGFQPDDDPQTKLRRLEGGIERALLPVQDVVPLVATLLGVPLGERYPPPRQSAELQRKRTMEALVAWTHALAEQQPLVMLFEDLHWCDPSTLEVIALALEQVAIRRVLILLTFRPSFSPPSSSFARAVPLSVGRLARADVAAMIASLTPGVDLPDALTRRIAERADGIPLFVEEVTKTVLESPHMADREGSAAGVGQTEIDIPPTLQDSLMERLDRLAPGKEVAQLAATIGREFPYALLRAVSLDGDDRLRAGLAQLVENELLYQRGTLPDASFVFKHALVQDTAYRSLLKSVRQPIHRRIAERLEAQFPERAQAEPEVVARHYDRAGFTMEAADRYRLAGERLAQRSANEEAIVHLRRALALVATLPEARERDRYELQLQMAIGVPIAAARGWTDPEYEQTYARAHELATRIGESPEMPRLIEALAAAYLLKGDLATSAEIAVKAMAAAQRTGAPFDLLLGHVCSGCPWMFQGHFDRALHHFEAAIGIYDPSRHAPLAHEVGFDRGIVAHAYAGLCHTYLGQLDRARDRAEHAIVLARRTDHSLTLVNTLMEAACVYYERREFDLVRERSAEQIAISQQLGFPFWEAIGRFWDGRARLAAGAGAAGFAAMQAALLDLAKLGTGIGASSFLFVLAESQRQLGQADEALGLLALALAQGGAQGEHYADAEILRLHGEILLAGDASAAAEGEALLQRAIALAHAQGARLFELRAAVSLARLWQGRGQPAEALALLAPRYAALSEGQDTADPSAAKRLLAVLESAVGRSPGAKPSDVPARLA